MKNTELASLLDLFELERGFTSEELKVAYRDLVQIWHPDRFAQNERLKQKAEKKLIEINEANIVLQNYLASKPRPRSKPRQRSQPKKDPISKSTSQRRPSTFLKNIFHPTDFSKTSDIAFAHALKIALSCNAKLNLMHVSQSSDKHVMQEFPKIRETLRSWNIITEKCTEKDIMKLGFRYQKVVGVHDSPAKSILNFLSKHPADLTVLATSQRQGADRLLKKSVAEDVSRASGGMTLFIPSQSKGFISNTSGEVNLKNILIPVDIKPNPLLAVNGAVKLASSLGCKNCSFTLAFIGDTTDMPILDIEDHSGWEWKRTVRRGNVVDMILKVVDEVSPDLIVMATKGHQGFLDAVRGSTTEQVLRKAPVPLLAVPAFRKK